MKLLRLAGCGLLLSALGGCASVNEPARAALSYYGGPSQVGLAAAATTSRRGQACINNYLGLIAVGDASIDAAKQNGGITKVASVDINYARVGGYYARFCTVVKGE